MTEASAMTGAPPEKIWRLWADVENWKGWDPSVERSSIGGSFAAGARGTLKPRGGPTSSFVVTEAHPGKSFSDRAALPLAALDFFHELEEVEGGTRITHRVRISGPASFLFAWVMGRKMARELPVAVDNLARMADGRPKGEAVG